MMYQLCILLNYNVFRTLQRDVSTIQQDSVIYRQCCMHSALATCEVPNLLQNRCDLFQGYSKSGASVFKQLNKYQTMFLQETSAKFNVSLETDHLLQLLQRYGTFYLTILGKRRISISLRNYLRPTIFKQQAPLKTGTYCDLV